MGSSRPKLTNPFAQGAWRERVVPIVLGIIVWWAVYYRVAALYGLGGGLVAATCAAWAYVAICACASYLLNSRGPGADRPGGPGGSSGSSGRWPGAAP